jgi:hypothetical protein
VSAIAFQIIDSLPQRHAAVPTLLFRLRLEESSGELIHNIALRCQIRIEPQRRRYSQDEEERLVELFGETPRWGDTLKPFLWTHVSLMMPGFERRTEVDLPVSCTYDLEVAAGKYLHCLDDGEIPLLFLFSGTVFAKGEAGLKVTQLSWESEAHYRLPVRVWRDLMNLYYPNSGWLRLQRETLDALMRFKAQRALPTWDGVMEALLSVSGKAGG